MSVAELKMSNSWKEVLNDVNFIVAKEGKQKLVFTEEQKDYIVEQYTTTNIGMIPLGKQFNVTSPTIKKSFR